MPEQASERTAATAVQEYVASTTLPRNPSLASVARTLEDVALREIDPVAAREVIAIDRAHDQRAAMLNRRIASRLDAMEEPERPDPASTVPDIVGVLVAAVGAALVLPAERFATTLPLPVGALWAAAILVLATIVHLIGFIIRVARRRRVVPAWRAILVSVVIVVITAGWILHRQATDGDGGDAIPFVVSTMTVCSVVLAVLSVITWFARSRAIADDRREDERARRAVADLMIEWEADQQASLAEARTVLARLDADERSELDAAVTLGIRATERAGLGFRHGRMLRAAGRLDLRYSDQPSSGEY